MGADESPDRALRVASAALGTVAAAESEVALYQGVCELLVRESGYALAWVGSREPDGSVRPMAGAGEGAYVRSVAVRWDEGAQAEGPTGRAIRSGSTQRALISDAGYAPWREAAQAEGFSASCALPLRLGASIIGSLNVYATREAAFDDAEVGRLEELASVLGRGVELFRGRAEIQTARDQLRALYDASPDLIFLHGADGRILDVNQRVLDAYGVTREQLLHGPPETTMDDGHTFEQALVHIRRALAEGSEDFEWEAMRGDGTTFPVEVRLRRLPGASEAPTGEPALVAIVRDLTERKRYEAQLVESSKMESLSLFAGGVAHDFNNFLSAVLGAASALQPRLADREQRALVDAVIEAAQGARGLTRQLLAFARGGASARGLFDLGPLLEQAARLALAGKGIRAQVDIAQDLWAIDGDRDQLASVFQNLLLNAAQATSDGGTVSLRAENVRGEDVRGLGAPELEPGPHVQIDVRDTGPGMNAETLRRAFDPFYTTKRGGSGLGLPTALAMVRRHQGRLIMDSEPGRGTRARVWLPARSDARPASSRSTPPPGERSSLHVLLLEDEPALQGIFRRMLEQLGHHVSVAPDGDAALALAATLRGDGARVDVAILDLTVRGGRGGREVLDELRALLPGTRVVGTSGYSDVDPATVPFDGFLPKPFTLDQLSRVLTPP